MKMTNTQRILKALTENEDIMKALANGNEWINERNRQPKPSAEGLIPKDCI